MQLCGLEDPEKWYTDLLSAKTRADRTHRCLDLVQEVITSDIVEEFAIHQDIRYEESSYDPTKATEIPLSAYITHVDLTGHLEVNTQTAYDELLQRDTTSENLPGPATPQLAPTLEHVTDCLVRTDIKMIVSSDVVEAEATVVVYPQDATQTRED